MENYFERIAPVWDYWCDRNRYYHDQLDRFFRSIIPPGGDVLSIGCGTGNLLHRLAPRRGVGLNIAEGLTRLARTRYPQYEFRTVPLDGLSVPDGFRPRYVVAANMLDYVHDLWEFSGQLSRIMDGDSLLIVTTTNPLWSPVFRLASRLGLRIPDSPRNYVTNRDIEHVLRLKGFEIVEDGFCLPLPVRLPLFSTAVNWIFPQLWGLHFTGAIQYITARLKKERVPLSCSVVVPCRNEEGNIRECVAQIPTLGVSTEIIVVDDGSTDSTSGVVSDMMREDPRVRLVRNGENKGKAAAIRIGWDQARGDVLIVHDADMTVHGSELTKFYETIQKGSAGLVNGTRLVYPLGDKSMPFLNYFGNKVFCFLMSWILRQRVSDALCGTKAFLKSDYRNMEWPGWDRWGDFELLYNAARLKLRIIEIPVRYRGRTWGKTKMRILRDGWIFLRVWLLCWFRLRRNLA